MKSYCPTPLRLPLRETSAGQCRVLDQHVLQKDSHHPRPHDESPAIFSSWRGFQASSRLSRWLTPPDSVSVVNLRWRLGKAFFNIDESGEERGDCSKFH